MPLSVTNTSLLQGLGAGNQTTWRVFVERYRPLIVRFARGAGLGAEEAEDVAQQTLLDFSRAYREGRFDRSRGRLRSWLFGIARNRLRSARRRQATDPVEALGQDGGRFDPAIEEADESRWDREWRDTLLGQCLEQLRREVAPRTYDAFRLFALEELSAETVSRRLGMTTNAVFLVKTRLIKRLRELLPVMEEVW